MSHFCKKKLWVVFTGKTDIAWLKILNKNFRHCFVVFKLNDTWCSIDPLSSFTDIQSYQHLKSSYNLPEWLIERGYTVVPFYTNSIHKRPAPLMFFTCIEAVKRILGLHKRFIYTPWQIYKYLIYQNKIDIKKGDLSWEA